MEKVIVLLTFLYESTVCWRLSVQWLSSQSFARIKKWLDHAKSSPNLTVIAGGNCDDSKGYFVEPTIIETKDPQDAIMNEVNHPHPTLPKMPTSLDPNLLIERLIL